MDVFLLWHIRHARNLDGSPIEHRDELGELLIDEAYDDVKVLGVYSTEPAAAAAIDRARLRDGFRDEPDCFMIAAYTLDEDLWTDGFITLRDNDDPRDQDQTRTTQGDGSPGASE